MEARHVLQVAVELAVLNRRCSALIDRSNANDNVNSIMAAWCLGDFHRQQQVREGLYAELERLTAGWSSDQKEALARKVAKMTRCVVPCSAIY